MRSLSQADLQRYLPAELAARLALPQPADADRVAAFDHLVAAQQTIGTYLPQCIMAHQLAAQPGPWLEWADGSLLFTDVSGSTALAERLTVLGREGIEIVTQTLNDFFATMIQVIQAAGGDLLTFGGDALLVLFTGPRHAHVATRAGLELLRQLAGFERTVPGLGTFPLTMHIGVESGRVALVSVGQPAELRYGAMGATVNRVACAEGYGGKGELVVGPQTWAAIAVDANGAAVAPGYVRIRALQSAAFTPLSLPTDPPIYGSPAQAIPNLIAQLDRICPYVPANLLARLLADPRRPRVEADLRPVTVLFAQVLGLGELVETLDPAAAAVEVDAFVRPMQAAVEQFGGMLNKLDLADEGAKLLAIFGAPIAYEDHAERAAHAALDMLAQMAGLQVRHPNLRLRIGLNTGPTFAGNVGSAGRQEYTVMGDAVNVAARVMARTAWDAVWCSASTADLIAARLRCEDRGLVMVKGKNEPLHLLRVVGATVHTGAPTGETHPLVGRREELAQLLAHVAAVQTGLGRVVRVSGEAGIGKSRLLAALVDQAQVAGVQVDQVRCLSYTNTTPYGPWADWLKGIADIAPEDAPMARASKLASQLALLGPDTVNWLPIFADLVRFEAHDTALTRALDPQQRQMRRFELIVELLRSRGSATHALLILVDDMQWADQVSVDLWHYAATRIADVPVLLLGVHRPVSTHFADGAAELLLHELSLEESEALLAAHLDSEAIPPPMRALIVARAAGNPLFLEELLHALINARHEAQGRAENDTALLDTLPDSLSGLLLARVDRLDEPTRALLRIAAVIGQRFPISILRSLYPASEAVLVTRLRDLEHEVLTLTERNNPERVETFRHALLQEVVYQSLLYARRRELHRQVAIHLEARYTDEIAALRTHFVALTASASAVRDAHEGNLAQRSVAASAAPIFLLAHHFRLSDAVDRSVDYLLLAGHVAREAYANEEAIQYYHWTLEALQDHRRDPRSWEAQEALGDVLCTVGRYDEALATYAAILQVGLGVVEHYTLPADLPPAIAAEALRSRGYALEKQGQYAAALGELQQAEALVRAHLDHVPALLFSAIYSDMGLVLMRRGEYDQALEVCMVGLTKLRSDRRSREDERIEADLHRQIGTIYGMRGDYTQARFHFENALAAQEDIDDLYGASRSHNNIGYLWQLQSEYEQALDHYARAEELAHKISAKYVLSSAYLNAAYAALCLSRYERAEEGIHSALALCEEMRDQSGIAQALAMQGQVGFERGTYAQALGDYARALTLQRALGGSYDEGITLASSAIVHIALGQWQQAQQIAGAAQRIGETIQAPQLQLEALNARAESNLLAARVNANDADLLNQAVAYAKQAAALADELGSRRDYGIARRLLGEIAALQGADFEPHFVVAAEIFAAIRNRFELARTHTRHAAALAQREHDRAQAYRAEALHTFHEIGAQGELAFLVASQERSV